MKNLNDVVVEKLMKFMNERNLTQYKLAQLSNLPLSTVKSIFQKRTKGITLKTIIFLASGLGITASEFISGNEFLLENLDLE